MAKKNANRSTPKLSVKDNLRRHIEQQLGTIRKNIRNTELDIEAIGAKQRYLEELKDEAIFLEQQLLELPPPKPTATEEQMEARKAEKVANINKAAELKAAKDAKREEARAKQEQDMADKKARQATAEAEAKAKRERDDAARKAGEADAAAKKAAKEAEELASDKAEKSAVKVNKDREDAVKEAALEAAKEKKKQAAEAAQSVGEDEGDDAILAKAAEIKARKLAEAKRLIAEAEAEAEG